MQRSRILARKRGFGATIDRMRLMSLVLLLPTLVACSGGGEPAAAPTETVTVIAEPTATTEPAVAAKSARLRTQQSTHYGSTAVLEFDRTVDSDLRALDALGHERWAGVLVRTCLDRSEEPTPFGWTAWSLRDAEGGLYPSMAGMAGAQFPQPTYPNVAAQGDSTTDTQPGDCVKGWVVFAVPRNAEFSEVIYDSGDDDGPPLRWKVPQE